MLSWLLCDREGFVHAVQYTVTVGSKVSKEGVRTKRTFPGYYYFLTFEYGVHYLRIVAHRILYRQYVQVDTASFKGPL